MNGGHRWNGRRIPVTIPAIAGPNSERVLSGPARFLGWSLLAGAGGATGYLSDGGQMVMQYAIAANAVANERTPQGGLDILTEFDFYVTAGSVSGVLWVTDTVPATEYDG